MTPELKEYAGLLLGSIVASLWGGERILKYRKEKRTENGNGKVVTMDFCDERTGNLKEYMRESFSRIEKSLERMEDKLDTVSDNNPKRRT